MICCLTYLGCQGDKMSMNVGIVEKDGRLEIYPSEQGLRLEVVIWNQENRSESSDPPKVTVKIEKSNDLVTLGTLWSLLIHSIFEQINQACLRELREETGLHFTEEHVDFTTLGLWE
ncbi:hypothetical protein QZH41_015305, partial [Actinostola sp. cb2023]